jgi:hypothetical protein
MRSREHERKRTQRGGLGIMKVLFVAGFGPIARNQQASEALYGGALRIFLERDGDYLQTGELDGVRHFALWPLSHAAELCFGSPSWPADLPVPQAWLELDVEDGVRARQELQDKGYQVLVAAQQEPWGQKSLVC